MADDDTLDELDELDDKLTFTMALIMITTIPWTTDGHGDHDNLMMTTAHKGLEKVTTVPKDLMTMRPIVLMMTMVLRKVLTMTTLVMETLIMTRGPIRTLMKTGVFGGDGDELDSLAELWQGY